MILVIGAGIFISFLLIFLLRGSAPNVPYQSAKDGKILSLGKRPGDDGSPTGQGVLPANPHDLPMLPENFNRSSLEHYCRKVIEALDLEFKSIDYHGQDEFQILARSEKLLLRGDVILGGQWCEKNTCIGSDVIISFSDMVKAERAMKGIFITNGFFSEEVMKLNEGANIELIDCHAMVSLNEQMGRALWDPK